MPFGFPSEGAFSFTGIPNVDTEVDFRRMRSEKAASKGQLSAARIGNAEAVCKKSDLCRQLSVPYALI